MKFSSRMASLLVEILLIGLFTMLLPTTGFAQAQVCGYVFLDANQDGVKNSDELARANHIVYLDDLTLMMNGQGSSFTTATDANGHYCFLANSIGGYGYWLRTDIPENSTHLTIPMQVDLKTGAMPPHSIQVTSPNQEVSVDFGFYGEVGPETPIFCESEEKDKSVCVHNSQFLMQVTPNNDVTEVKNMVVEVVKDENGKDAYVGDNNTSMVAVVEKELATRRKTRDGNEVEDFVITVGKDLSDDGEEFSLDARINTDGSVSFSEQDVPNVVATSTSDGFVVTDSDSPTVSVEVANSGDITATDSDDPTMGLFVNGSTGEVIVTDTEYSDTLAVINSDGSFQITDSQFPDLVATVYGDRYVVKDIKNDVVVNIDSLGNYTIIDNANQMCFELPRIRGLGSFVRGVVRGIKKVFSSITRFVQKIAGFIGKVSRFVARVAPKISKALRIVAMVARVAAIVFPGACQFFCAVAAFAESAANFTDAVGAFASKVATIAEAIQSGNFNGFWVGNLAGCNNTQIGIPDDEFGKEGEFPTTVNTDANQILMNELFCNNSENTNNNQTSELFSKQIIKLSFKGNGGNDGLVTSTPGITPISGVGIRCEAGKSCSPKEIIGNITLTVVGKRFLRWGTGCAFSSGGTSRTCILIANNDYKDIEVKFEGIILPLARNEIRGYDKKNRQLNDISYCPETMIYGKVRDSGNSFHGGWDLVAPIGKDVYAIADGVIEYTRNSTAPCGGYGKCISISFDFDGNNYFAFYAHLDKIKVNVGKIEKGDIIGTTGNTDATFLDTSEYHLHFETRDKPLSKWTKGDAIDPQIIYTQIPPDEPNWKKIAVSITGSGQVTSTTNSFGNKIDCKVGTCSKLFEGSVTLTATPTNGSQFEKWEGDCSGNSPTCNLQADKATNTEKKVTAVFQ